MKILKKGSTFLFVFLCILPIYAQTPDDNVIISEATDVYTFSESNGSVIVTNKRQERYTSLRTWENVQPFTFYGQGCTLDYARCFGFSEQHKNITSSGVFSSDTKVCFFDARLNKKGDHITPSFKRTFTDVRYFSSISFYTDYFIKDKEIKIIIPASLKRFAVKGINLPPSITEHHEKDKTGADVYIYKIANMPATPNDSNRPDDKGIIVVTGVFSNYADLYAWGHKMVDEVDCTIADIDKIVAEATQGAKTDIDKVAKTFEWVQNNIRYVAVENGENAWKPDAPQEVIRKKYGDCKGMSLLLRTLLRHQGIDARVADVSSQKRSVKPSEIAALCAIDHMVCVAYVNGKEFWLDATNKYAPLGFAPDWTSNCEAIVEDGNKCKLVHMPIHQPTSSVDSLWANYRYDPEGILIGKLCRSFSGDIKQSVLSTYFGTENQKRSLFSARLLGSINNDNIETSNLVWEGTDSHSYNATLEANVKNKSAVELLDDEAYVSLNPIGDVLLPIIDSDKRKSDYELPMSASSNVTAILAIPNNMAVESTPDDLTIETDNVSLNLQCEVSKNQTVVFRKTVVIKDRVIPLDKIAEWNATIKRWNDACNEQIALKKKSK